MALPDRDSLLTMNWSGNGSPFCHVAAKSGIDLDGLDWSMIGSPWWGLPVSGGGATSFVTADAVATGIATESRLSTFYRDLDATAIGIAALTKGMFVTATAVAAGIAVSAQGKLL